MLIAYLVCLLAGAVLISLSLDNEGSLDGEPGNLSLLFSTPFWSFGLTGFGLCGLLMLLLAPSGSWIPASAVALIMGSAMGWAATKILRAIGKQEANSLVRGDDLIGQQGTVSLAIEPGQRGFVELMVRGSLIRRPARSLHGLLARGTEIVVVNAEGNTLLVESLGTPI
ncbi:MAG: NfeD family protein [Cyanobacteriota bacterium]|nr:NfeD family protein [Cyanobacteriota bacterium]